MTISASLAQASAAAPAGSDSMMGGLGAMLPLLIMFAVMYFLMIRPQMKREKERKAMIEALVKGDEVIIGGGLLGRVTKLGESFLHVELAAGTEVQVQRGAVLQVMPKGTMK
jgi:preprotein translocase subunit YajC